MGVNLPAPWTIYPVKTLDAIVRENDISLDTEWGGICGWLIHDIKIINNEFTGMTGLAGIYLGGGFLEDNRRSKDNHHVRI